MRVSFKKWCETRLCHIPLALQRVYECSDERDENGMGRMGVRFLEEGRE